MEGIAVGADMVGDTVNPNAESGGGFDPNCCSLSDRTRINRSKYDSWNAPPGTVELEWEEESGGSVSNSDAVGQYVFGVGCI